MGMGVLIKLIKSGTLGFTDVHQLVSEYRHDPKELPHFFVKYLNQPCLIRLYIIHEFSDVM